MKSRCVVVAALLLACSSALYADVFGSINGVVRDQSGGALPGVTATLTSQVLPKGRDTVTDRRQFLLSEVATEQLHRHSGVVRSRQHQQL
jgi:hypothetical protein